MKRDFSLLTLVLLFKLCFSQSPQKLSYQSVLRNAGNQLVANQQVGIKIYILQGNANGTAVYAETHSPLSNANGLVTLEIGGGMVLSGNFANINWASGPYFVKTETDLNGGNTYTLTSTQQLLSVPYALCSNDVRSSVSDAGDTLYIGSSAYIVPGISAANNAGGQTGITAHTCGATSVHNPDKTYGTMTDQQGNVYRTIVIGSQEWMAENLKTSIYRNGDPIANVTSITQWAGLPTGAWCHYNNESQNDCPYGKLYNWYTAVDARNVCPNGWHVPTNEEWNTLLSSLDPLYNPNLFGIQSAIAGSKLKSTGILHWSNPNQDATNESGFSSLPGGGRDDSGPFYSINGLGAWWNTDSYARFLNANNGEVSRDFSSASSGFSIRCLKD
jgi:uncharacterized protein (TIGR02145 family)